MLIDLVFLYKYHLILTWLLILFLSWGYFFSGGESKIESGLIPLLWDSRQASYR